MASSPLIACPRKSTQDVDFVQPIQSTIASVYQEDPRSYAEECGSLNRCRQDALRGSAGSDLTARDLLLKYFGQLELLELRFPDLRVPFPWSDAFTSKQISQLSLAYEKASVIFNMAATLTNLAASQSRASNEGLKRAFNFFRQACGLFQYINENFLHAPSTDLSREVVRCLVGLMHAQATEVFIERMNVENKSAGLKARVCMQAAFLYHGLIDDARDFVSKGWFSRSWMMLVQCKASYFTSQAQYNKSLQDTAASRYGDAITRLTIAQDAAKEATRFASGFASVFAPGLVPTLPSDSVSCLTDLTKQQLSLVSNALTTSKRENDLIYHASPTSEATLPAIDKSVVSEPFITIQEIYAAPEVQKTVGQDIFIKLVPLAVTESASLYSEEKAKLVRAQSEAVEVADGELANALDYLGLPSSLAKFKHAIHSGNGAESQLYEVPDHVRSRSQQIALDESSSTTSISGLLQTLQDLRRKCATDLDAIVSQLDTEERECESTRRQYADAGFDQLPASAVPEFKAYRTDAKARKENLQSAYASDEIIFTTWERARADVELLKQEQTLEAYYKTEMSDNKANQDLLGDLSSLDGDAAQDQELSQRIASIEELMNQLKRLKSERTDVLRDLKERTQSDDISHLLILNRKSQNIEPTLFATELEKFRGHQSRITSTLNHESTTLQELFAEFKALTESNAKGREIQNKFGKAERKRRELAERFSKAYASYVEVKTGAAKGCEFYKELAGLVDELQRNVTPLCQKRRAERSSAISTSKLSEQVQSSLNLGDPYSQLDALTKSPPLPPPRPSSIATPTAPPPQPYQPHAATPPAVPRQPSYRPAPPPPTGSHATSAMHYPGTTSPQAPNQAAYIPTTSTPYSQPAPSQFGYQSYAPPVSSPPASQSHPQYNYAASQPQYHPRPPSSFDQPAPQAYYSVSPPPLPSQATGYGQPSAYAPPISQQQQQQPSSSGFSLPPPPPPLQYSTSYGVPVSSPPPATGWQQTPPPTWR